MDGSDALIWRLQPIVVPDILRKFIYQSSIATLPGWGHCMTYAVGCLVQQMAYRQPLFCSLAVLVWMLAAFAACKCRIRCQAVYTYMICSQRTSALAFVSKDSVGTPLLNQVPGCH